MKSLYHVTTRTSDKILSFRLRQGKQLETDFTNQYGNWFMFHLREKWPHTFQERSHLTFFNVCNVVYSNAPKSTMHSFRSILPHFLGTINETDFVHGRH